MKIRCKICNKETKYKKCYSCSNSGTKKLGDIGPFIRNCNMCSKEVEFLYKRSYSISLKHDCFCKDCRKKRYSRNCPICNIEIFVSSPSRVKRFEGKRCKSCESMERLKNKKSYGFSGTYNSLFFRSTLELSFLIEHTNEKIESGENSKWRVEYILNEKAHYYYPDYVIENRMIEIKPLYARKGEVFNLKVEAARKFCENNGMIFELQDPSPISKDKLLEMHNSKIIHLNPKTLRTINKSSCE